MKYNIIEPQIGSKNCLKDGKEIDIDILSGQVVSSHNVLSGVCPFCYESSGFKQVFVRSKNITTLRCDTCHLYVLYDHSREIVLPVAIPNSLDDLPENIDKYYKEALRCMAAESPSGAATLFRKLIHQVGIHYGVAKMNDNHSIMSIVQRLKEEERINSKLAEALRKEKDLGDDGVHVNENEPRTERIYHIKGLIDSFLEATVLQDRKIHYAEYSRRQTSKITYPPVLT